MPQSLAQFEKFISEYFEVKKNIELIDYILPSIERRLFCLKHKSNFYVDKAKILALSNDEAATLIKKNIQTYGLRKGDADWIVHRFSQYDDLNKSQTAYIKAINVLFSKNKKMSFSVPEKRISMFVKDSKVGELRISYRLDRQKFTITDSFGIPYSACPSLRSNLTLYNKFLKIEKFLEESSP